MVRLSVIIPGYRTPLAWWQRSIQSALQSSLQNDEIVCVDDGSPDGATFLDEEPRVEACVRIIHRRNAGLSVARNTALDHVRGEWVAFVDSDDEVLPEAYVRTLASMETGKADVGLFGVRTIWTAERLCKVDAPQKHCYGKLTPHHVRTLSTACLLNYVWNKVYRKDFLEAHRLRFAEKGMPCEDIIFNLECIMAGARWCAIDCVGYVYYRTGTTLLSTYRPFNDDGLRLCTETWRRYIRETLGAEQLFQWQAEAGEGQYLWAEWDNIWRPRSPYSMAGKLRFLRSHRPLMIREGRGWQNKLLRIAPMILLLARYVYQVLRRWAYVRPMRRRHIRRLYPQVLPWTGQERSR